MTIVLEYTQSLIAPIIMHFIWNAVGAIILGGVSLADDYPYLFSTEFIELIILSIIALLLIFLFRKDILYKKTNEYFLNN